MNNNEVGTLSVEDIGLIYSESEKYSQDRIVTEHQGLVVMLDVLGWKAHNNDGQIEKHVENINFLKNRINDTLLRCMNNIEDGKVDVVTLSDTILILIDNNSSYHPLNIFGLLSEFILKGLEKGFAYRGSISYGKYKKNISSNVFIGNAIYDAHKYCESTDWAGIILTDEGIKYLEKFENLESSSKELNLINYSDIPYKNKKIINKNNYVLLPLNRLTHRSAENKIIHMLPNFEEMYKTIMSSSHEKVKKKLANTLKFYEYARKNGFINNPEEELENIRKEKTDSDN